MRRWKHHLKQLEDAGISWKDISTIFVTHKHIDHLLGIIWMLRMYCQGMARGQFDGEVVIYGHDEVISLLEADVPIASDCKRNQIHW